MFSGSTESASSMKRVNIFSLVYDKDRFSISRYLIINRWVVDSAK